MDDRKTRDQVENDPEEVVDGEAVEVETVEAVDEHELEQEADADVPPFLEREDRAGKATASAEEVDVQADEVEPETRTRTEQPEEGYLSLFDDGAAPEYRKRWADIQAQFVDDPKASVREADELVAQVVKHISDTFARQRSQLEAHWKADGDTESSTEDLRLAVKRYHTFFDQLLNLNA